jgi:arylsulfatase A-like enzyme
VSRRPNLLLISIDTLRADRLGTYGYARPTSPALDARLGARGVVFENAWSQSPKTTPSHMTMLTSLLPSAHGVGMWEGQGPAPRLSRRVHTLAELLKNAGYATAAFTAGAHMHRDRGFGQGFDVYRHGRMLPRAVEYLRAYPRRPFFLFFHTYDVHDPYLPPREVAQAFVTEPVPAIEAAIAGITRVAGVWPQAHERFWAPVDPRDPRHVRHVSDLYDAVIRRMDDRVVTTLLDTLDTLGLAEETLVVFLSDHGEEFQEHGRFLHESLSPEVLHVPLILRLPGRLPAGRRVRDPVCLVDVLPTLLDLLGVPAPAVAQGRSLGGLARGDEDALPPRPILAEYSWPGRRFERIRRDGMTLVIENDREVLYDAIADPRERHDIAPAEPARLAQLRAELDRRHGANLELATRLGPRAEDMGAPSAKTMAQLRALGYLD